MCGINGFSSEDRRLISVMNRTIAHRGPDDTGVLVSNGISLGHTRLSIIDLSIKGHQPMSYARKGKIYVITFNGEIYNYKQLRKELSSAGHTFRSNSDTEIIMAAYDAWGSSCVSRFRGIWAFCIHDIVKKELFFSRDRFGQKPLYYAEVGGVLYFSSEIKSLMKGPIPKELDKLALREYFSYRAPFFDRTLFSSVKTLLPGHNLVYDLKKKKITSYKQYYKLKLRVPPQTFSQAKEQAFSLIENAVKERMVADVPVATFLSGGLDSSIVTAFAKRENKNLHTFSVGFDTTNELSYASRVAKYLETEHHEYTLDKDSALSYLDEMMYHMDEPIGADPGFLPIFVLSKKVHAFNKVILSGDSADEVFGGYDRYKFVHYGKLLKHVALHPTTHELVKRLHAMRGKTTFNAFMEANRVFETKELNDLGIREAFDRDVWNMALQNDFQRMQYVDVVQLLPKDLLMKADKMSSAFGLEQRAPFMDYRVVEFGLSLPTRWKLNLLTEKYILKKTFANIIPREIIERSKHGFNVPIDYWFTHALGDKLRVLVKKSTHGLYNKELIYKLLEQIKTAPGGFKARNIIAQKLWTVLVFEMWYEKYVK
ncbi:MAG: asparagine synthase (glutamine-hydrolyzing) [Candidatus Woesearchaeota archaeon]|nr:MAG: asparagine synthase (glutamine-hydrolyzing) [Candidatus Woesearchaeota archaeon]